LILSKLYLGIDNQSANFAEVTRVGCRESGAHADRRSPDHTISQDSSATARNIEKVRGDSAIGGQKGLWLTDHFDR